jgi:hypothetical protein
MEIGRDGNVALQVMSVKSAPRGKNKKPGLIGAELRYRYSLFQELPAMLRQPRIFLYDPPS